jgi:hypothetical protein
MRSLALLSVILLASCAPETPEQQFDREIAAEPGAARIMAAMEETFPQEHAALRQRLIALIAAGGTPEQFRMTAAQAFSRVVEQNKQHLAAAPQANLEAVIRSQRIAAEALQAHAVEQCAAYVMGGSVTVPDADASVKSGLSDSTVAVLRAAAAGRTQPVDRSRDSIGQSDINAFSAGLRSAGADQATIDAAIGNGFFGMSAQGQCAGGIAILKALESMEDAPAARIFAAMVSA